jgi:hypothetical protein
MYLLNGTIRRKNIASRAYHQNRGAWGAGAPGAGGWGAPGVGPSQLPEFVKFSLKIGQFWPLRGYLSGHFAQSKAGLRAPIAALERKSPHSAPGM